MLQCVAYCEQSFATVLSCVVAYGTAESLQSSVKGRRTPVTIMRLNRSQHYFAKLLKPFKEHISISPVDLSQTTVA